MGYKEQSYAEESIDKEMLLIPMGLKAMLFGKPRDKFADTAYDYSSLEEKPLGDFVEPNLRGSHADEDSGIHLHWILPDTLKQGMQNDDSDIVDYPTVPNRWQITRVWTSMDSTGGDLHSQSWNVESDVLQKDRGMENFNHKSPQYPVLEDDNQPYRYLGRAYPANQNPSACKEFLAQNTAIAPGLPAFAAYYPDCRNVFGFYDNMTDEKGNELINVSVTYVVCGWYSDSTQDILSTIKSPADCAEKLNWLAPEQFVFPAKSLCHGTISGIRWDSKAKQYDSNIPAKDPLLAVGNTTAEALAALLETGETGGCEIERMLNLFFSSGELLQNERNGLLKGENKLHEDRFGKESPVTQLAFKENGSETTNVGASPPEDRLKQLNDGYVELLYQKSHLRELLEQVYDTWYKYVFLGEQTYFDPDDKKKAVECQKKYISLFETLERTISGKRFELDALLKDLSKKEEELSKMLTDHALVHQTGQPFWAPNDPVLLLSGIQGDGYNSADSNGTEGLLFCRSILQLNHSLTIDKFEGVFDIPTTIQSEDISCSGLIPDTVAPFVREALLLSPDFATTLAAAILDIRGCKTKENMAALTPQIIKLQQAPVSRRLISSFGRDRLSAASGFDGLFPDARSLVRWSKPWTPLFIQWFVNYYPDPALLEDIPTLKQWEMKEDLADYRFIGKILTDKPEPIQGQSILTPHGAAVTAACLAKNLGDQALAEESLLMDVLSQTLNINNAHAMIKTDIRLPVEQINVSHVDLSDDTLPVKKILAMLDGYLPEISHFDEFFSPVRGGFMNIDKISIIDSFGQLKEISKPIAKVTENMRNNKSVSQANIMLTPRLIQPSRLNFRWYEYNRDVPMSENSTISPVCGWLLPNHTDCSVMVYDRVGNLLGSLQRVKLDTPVVWKNPPEKGGGTAPIPTDMNPTLAKIITSILNICDLEREDLLTPLMQVIDSALWSINPSAAQQFNSLGQYIGRPLIVVNAGVLLEQMDIPKPFKHLETRDDTGGYNSHIDVTKAKFAVQVGRKADHGDGVIGFYKDNNYNKLYITGETSPFPQAFLEANNTATLAHEYFDVDNTVTLASGEGNPIKLTIIMDFAASVNLIAGFLPTKTVKPDTHAISEALNKLYFTIFSAPVLGDESEFAVPCPKLEGRQWKWLHYRDSVFATDEISPATSQAYFPKTPTCAQEGWLKLEINDHP